MTGLFEALTDGTSHFVDAPVAHTFHTTRRKEEPHDLTHTPRPTEPSEFLRNLLTRRDAAQFNECVYDEFLTIHHSRFTFRAQDSCRHRVILLRLQTVTR